MKISQIIQETSTTAGSVAPVEHGFVKMQTRNPGVYGGNKVGNLLKGKKTNKAFANSVNESAEISETDLSEQDLIVVPGQGRSSKSGFVPHGQSRVDHEVEMARSDLFSAAKNAKKVYSMIKDLGEDEGLDGWVQEKIIKANDYLNTIREYLEGKQVQGVAEGEGKLDELSPKALGSYVKSASGDMAKRTGDTQFQKGARVATSAFNSKQSPSRFEKDTKIEKRQAGIDRAVDKITGKK